MGSGVEGLKMDRQTDGHKDKRTGGRDIQPKRYTYTPTYSRTHSPTHSRILSRILAHTYPPIPLEDRLRAWFAAAVFLAFSFDFVSFFSLPLLPLDGPGGLA